jgi:hypothetical protein
VTRFEPLVRCDGPGWCGALVEPHAARCSGCAKAHGRSPNAIGKRGHARPDPNGGGMPEATTKPELVPCCGLIGAGCPDGALVARLGKRKRCQACQAALDRRRAKRSDPTRPMPLHVWQEQRRREAERERKRGPRKPHRVPSGRDLPSLLANNPAQVERAAR